jgi:tRNA G10  N-methylase Trm11
MVQTIARSHEDIRYAVISKLRKSILYTINNIRSYNPQVYSNLKDQLDEYEKIIREEEDIPLIIKNEKIIEDVGRPDIEVFGGKLLIEVKVKPQEFQIAKNQLSSYIKSCPYTQYAIVTNDDLWAFYKIEKGELIPISQNIEKLNEIIQEILTEGIKIPLSTENVKNMFNPIISFVDELYEIFKNNKIKDTALFQAYKNIMNKLYEGASDKDIEILYIKHTLMQIIVSSCLTAALGKRTKPINACFGEEIEAEIILPYLNWLIPLIKTNSNEAKFINSILESTYSRSLLLDWKSENKEDAFRELYEILIDSETRRKLGEYYTPLWLVEYMINNVSQGLKDKIILDPFCGSGTFLISAFYKKIQEGEDPEKAIREIIGFDINPLAVSIARAELMIAYQKVSKGMITPLIFNTDSASILLRANEKLQPISFLEELKILEEEIAYIKYDFFIPTEVDFSEILMLETILREYFKDASKSEKIKEKLENNMLKLKNVKWGGTITSTIIEKLIRKESIDAISKLIEKYKNGVWAVSITSLFAPYIIQKTKVDIIITNPPWALLTTLKGDYGKLMREKAKGLLKGHEKIGQILISSDLSSVLLHGCLELSKGEVAFLMPKDAVYTFSSYHGVGKILTYNIIKNHNAKIIEFNFDAFEHGRIPSIVFLEKKKITKENIKIYFMDIKFKDKYSKALHLSDIEFNIKEREENYENYINKVIRYTKITPEILKKILGVEEIFPMGEYIRGLLGGEKKRGAKKYAGLIFEIKAYDNITRQYIIKLSSLDKEVKISKHFLDPYWKKLIYRGKVFPFYFDGTYNILLSSDGENDLKEFLRRYIAENLSGEERKKVEILIEELKQPNKPYFLKENTHYVIYRCSGTFSSFVLTPQDIQKISENGTFKILIESHCSFLSLTDKIKAYYYSAILNYLAYKVIEKGGTFERDQFLRPLISIYQVSLEWKNEEWQKEIAKLGEKLHQKTPTCFKNYVKKGMKVERIFHELDECKETKDLFKELRKKIDDIINERKLREALSYVCKFSE